MSELIQFPKSKESSIAELAIELATIQVKDGVHYTPELQEKCYRLAEQLYHQRTSQRVSIPFSESSFMGAKPKTVKQITKKQSKILDVASEIQEKSAKEANTLVFMAKPFVQTTLPHRDPGEVLLWNRRNGRVTLSIKPDAWENPTTGVIESVGVPFGVIPRLLLMWISTDVLQRKERRLYLGKSLSDFMKELKLDPRQGGKKSDAYRLKEQMRRLFRCRISLDEVVKEGRRTTNNWMEMQIAWQGSMSWVNPVEEYRFTSIDEELEEITTDSWIELSEPFFNMVKDSCVPLDYRLIREIKQSPLALDLYAWMVQRTYSNPDVVDIFSKRSFVSWQQLHAQFGSNYGRIDHFRDKVKPILKQIQTASDNLCLKVTYGGLNIEKK